MARRFVVNDDDISKISANTFSITGSEVKHIQVLRHDVGDEITVNGGIYIIKEMRRDSILLEYIKEAESIGVPRCNVTLYVAFLKNDKMDFVVQKAVELGVKKIVPFFSNNVVVKLDEKARLKRKEKLQKIAIEACKQCGRSDIVLVSDFLNFNELVKDVMSQEKVLFAYEASEDLLKKEMIDIREKKYKSIGIVIGAEGGFSENEAKSLSNISNVFPVSLGKRILRAETAAISLLSIVMYEEGEL